MENTLLELDLALPSFKLDELDFFGVQPNPKGLNPLLILTLDMSFTGTGICLYHTVGHKISASLLKPRVGKGAKNVAKKRQRILLYTKVIQRLLETHSPLYVSLEGYSFGSRTAAYDLGELGGAIRLLLEAYYKANGLDWEEYVLLPPPTTLKKFITGKGNAGKNVMLLELYSRFGLKTDDDNICDAVSVALFTLKKYFPSKFKKQYPGV